jgi:hypothetical protein
MNKLPALAGEATPIHEWLQYLNVAYVPGPLDKLLERAAEGLLLSFEALGHSVERHPSGETDLILTSASLNEPLDWRKSLFFNARMRFRLKSQPTVCTLIHLRPDEFQQLLAHFELALSKDLPDAADFDFPGLAGTAYETLFEQGRRGGPILSLQRMLQAQCKCLRIILFIGDETPEMAYSFDLVGAFPCTLGTDQQSMYRELALRLVTALSSGGVTNHEIVEPPIKNDLWRGLSTPKAMQHAGDQLNKRGFFTKMVRVADLVDVPAMNDAIANQYSEGCYATWEPRLDALVATVTGSLRPVVKGQISDEDLAVIVGLNANGTGAKVRQIEAREYSSPSSESVEMFAIDNALPRIAFSSDRDLSGAGLQNTDSVPVARSKLHGHRGVARFDPTHVEFVALEAEYHHFPVSCGTLAQAEAVVRAFSRSKALREPADERMVVFTILPGHGVFIVEKWHTNHRPFELIWEFMDKEVLQIDSFVPQGRFSYTEGPDRLYHLHEE